MVLPDDPSIVITPNDYPALNSKSGENIITASGLTLLGSDDKAGVTAIMEAAIYLKITLKSNTAQYEYFLHLMKKLEKAWLTSI